MSREVDGFGIGIRPLFHHHCQLKKTPKKGLALSPPSLSRALNSIPAVRNPAVRIPVGIQQGCWPGFKPPLLLGRAIPLEQFPTLHTIVQCILERAAVAMGALEQGKLSLPHSCQDKMIPGLKHSWHVYLTPSPSLPPFTGLFSDFSISVNT